MENQELNELVAIDVMQYEKQSFKGQEGYGTANGLVFFSHFTPSENIQHAWKVIEKLEGKGVKFRIHDNGSGYVVSFWHERKPPHVICESETVEKAICKAAIQITSMLEIEGSYDEPWLKSALSN